MKTPPYHIVLFLCIGVLLPAQAQDFAPDAFMNQDEENFDGRHSFAYGKDKVEALFNDSLHVDGLTFTNSAHFFQYSGANFNVYLSTGELSPIVEAPTRSFLKLVGGLNSGEFEWNNIADTPISLLVPLGVRMSYVNTSAKTDSSGFTDNHIGTFGLSAGLVITSLIRTAESLKYLDAVRLTFEYNIAPSALTNAGVDVSDVRMSRFNLTELRMTLWNPGSLPFGLFTAVSWERQYISRSGAAPSELIQSVVSNSDLDRLSSSRFWRFGISF